VRLSESSMPVVPRSAVLEMGSQHKIFVVSDGRLQERYVQVGEAAGTSIGVMAGVRVGERVVAVARDDMRDGLKLQ